MAVQAEVTEASRAWMKEGAAAFLQLSEDAAVRGERLWESGRFGAA